MNRCKEAEGGQRAALTGEDLERIGRLARRPLKEEELYAFSVRLCDNEIDRDWERFSPETLKGLAPLFVGKSGIFDHQWSARGQAARIYKTELIREPGRLTRAGDPYCWLKGCAYMVRTQGNPGPDRRDRGGYQEGGQRGLRRGAGGVLRLRPALGRGEL